MQPKPRILLLGHMTADLVNGGRIIGGTVSYAARTAFAFGFDVYVLTSAVVDDPLLDELRPYTKELVVVPAESTSTFENIYLPSGRVQYLRGVARPLTYADVPSHWHEMEQVLFAPLTGELDGAIMQSFPRSTTLLTGQGLLRQWGEDGRVTFKSWADANTLSHLDWFVLSEEDIAPVPELEARYAQLTRHFVLTRAEKGGTHYDHAQPLSYSTPQVEVVQPTGAGDVFAVGLLCALHLTNGNINRSLTIAAHAGAITVTRPGWEGAPTSEEINELLRLGISHDAIH